MGMPMIIGAGIGALGSAAMGKSPFTGALLGGSLGGLGGAGGLFGAAEGAGAGIGGLSAAPVATTAGEIAIPSTSLLEGVAAPSVGINTSALSGGITDLGIKGISSGIVPNASVQLASAPMAGLDYGIGAGTTLAGGEGIYQAPSFADKLAKIPSQMTDWASSNPLSAGKMVMDVATHTPQQRIQAPSGGIIRNNFDPSSTLLNVAPSLGLSKDELSKGKMGQIAQMAHLTDEDKRKIGEFYTSLIG